MPGRCHDARATVLGKDDRHPLEGEEAAQLADERREGLVELEGRAERTGAPVRGLEDVDPPPERVAQPLRLRRPLLRNAALAPEPQHEPADDQRHDRLDTDLERDMVEAVSARRGM